MMDVDNLRAKAIVVHNDTFSALEKATHFVATIASQSLPSERDDSIEQDWKHAFETAVIIARGVAEEMKLFLPSPKSPKEPTP